MRVGQLIRSAAAGLVFVAGVAGLGGTANAQRVDPARDPQALPDMVLGAEDAPVTIVEYASMTCPHCQSFHVNTFEAFREKYIETGQVRFIFREFPLDIRAVLGSMVARCAPEDQFYDIIGILFENQGIWAVADDPVLAVYDLVKQTGFSEASFQACLQNNELYAGIVAVQTKAQEYGVDSTPTFFVNGQRVPGAQTLEQMDAILAPLL